MIMDRAHFTEAALLADASARTGGLTDLGPDLDDFRQSLAVLVESTFAEARLRDLAPFRDFLLHHLGNRLRIQACLADHPEVLDLAVPRPVFISGLPRAGTTTFSRLVGEDPHVRTLRLWELLSPAPTDRAHPWALTEDRIAAAEQLVLARARRGTLDLRPMSIFLPDECFYLMRNSFNSDHLHRAVARRPTYFRWITQRDRGGVYAYYKRQLQLLLWQRPCPPTGQLVLKNPFVHLENLEAIFALFPGATIVNLTRDVVSVLASLCYKNRADRQAHSDHVDPLDVGADMVENLEIYYRRRAAQLLAISAEQRARVVTLDFAAWADDPVAIMRQVYQHTGQPFSDELAARMTAALPRHSSYGERARYDLADFGLRADELRERFEPHEERFRRQCSVIGPSAAEAAAAAEAPR
jgi:Sulfotransferase family